MPLTISILKWGNGQDIRIPKSVLELLNWSDCEKLELIAETDCIKIKKVDVKKRKNIKELFKNYNGNYEKENIDWGDPVGKEIW